MSQATKLSKAQRAFLIELDASDQGCVESYAPAKKLVELGLAQWMYTRTWQFLRITPAGRAMLSASPLGEQ